MSAEDLAARTDLATWSGDAVQQLLSGRIHPEDFACRIVPAPQEALRRSSLGQTRMYGYAFLIVVLLICGSLATALITTSLSIPRIAGLIVLLIATALTMTRLGVNLAIRREIAEIDSRSPINEFYRSQYHDSFLQELEQSIAEREAHGKIDPSFVQSVVTGIQQALYRVNVPNPQVCILRSERHHEHISYYAGCDEPQITQGAVIPNLSLMTSRRVVYSQSCGLGLDEDTHHLAVIATCASLSDPDRDLVEQATALLSSACSRGVALGPVDERPIGA
jgi:hypothetical protein